MVNPVRHNLVLVSDTGDAGAREIIGVLKSSYSVARVILISNDLLDDPGIEDITLETLPEKINGQILRQVVELADDNSCPFACCAAGTAHVGMATLNAMSLAARYCDSLCFAKKDGSKGLQEIPFVRLRYLYADKKDALRLTAHDLADTANSRISRLMDAPELTLRPDDLTCNVGYQTLTLDVPEFILFWLFALRCKNEVGTIRSIAALAEEFNAFTLSTTSTVMPDICEFRKKYPEADQEVIRAKLDSATSKILDNIPFDNGRDLIIPYKDDNSFGFSFPPQNINCPRNY
ncbi:MAG: hypothetical protein JW808_08650 [Victivallales bacterium]|nr:hypothetical protein [Victivallales bacterium]